MLSTLAAAGIRPTSYLLAEENLPGEGGGENSQPGEIGKTESLGEVKRTDPRLRHLILPEERQVLRRELFSVPVFDPQATYPATVQACMLAREDEEEERDRDRKKGGRHGAQGRKYREKRDNKGGGTTDGTSSRYMQTKGASSALGEDRVSLSRVSRKG